MKVNLSRVIADHWRCYFEPKGERPQYSSLALAVVPPVMLATVAWARKTQFSDSFLGAVLTAFSVFAGLLLNMLVLNFDIIARFSGATTPSDKEKLRLKVVRQTHSNISYATLVCVIVILVAPCALLASQRYSFLLSGVLVALLVHFVFTGMLVLRRIYGLMQNAIEAEANAKAP